MPARARAGRGPIATRSQSNKQSIHMTYLVILMPGYGYGPEVSKTFTGARVGLKYRGSLLPDKQLDHTFDHYSRNLKATKHFTSRVDMHMQRCYEEKIFLFDRVTTYTNQFEVVHFWRKTDEYII